MRKILTAILFLMPFIGFSQLHDSFLMYRYSPNLVNPAFAGINNMDRMAYSRKAFNTEFPGHPVSSILSYDGKFNSINSGIGLNWQRNNIGVHTTDIINGQYNYQIKFNDQLIGIGAGLFYQQINSDWELLNYPISTFSGREYSIHGNAGISYMNGNFLGGISLKTYFNNPSFSLSPPSKSRFNLFAEYHFKHEKFEHWPSVFVETGQRSARVDLNYFTKSFNFILLGASYRNFGDINQYNVMGGVSIKNTINVMMLAYSNSFQQPKHNYEFMVNVNLKNLQRQ